MNTPYQNYNFHKFKEKFKLDLNDTLLTRKSSYGTFIKIEGDLKHPKTFLSDKYESLDYDPSENSLMIDDEKKLSFRDYKIIQCQRWLIMLMIGVITAIFACVIDISIDFITEYIYIIIKIYLDDMTKIFVHNSIHRNLTSAQITTAILKPYISWVGISIACVIAPCLLVIFVEPMASGSGISQIKCFLNGVKIPNIVRLKTLIIKVFGIIFAISSGLIIGKEGPMVHIGSIIGAGISQGCSTSLKFDLKIFKKFRTDTEKRDFVSAGTAAGLSAAFGAPIGGLLLSLEEGASFWNQALTWRIFLASLTSSFTLNVIMSAYHGHPGELSNTGLINFGKLNDIYYNVKEIPIFILMAIAGGILGALFNHINIKLTLFRMRHITKPSTKILEVLIVTLITISIVFNLIYYSDSCVPLPTNRQIPRAIKLFCGDNEYNSVATILFQTSEHRIRSLFHEKPETFSPIWLLALFLMWYILACWTFGISVPSGLFIPSLLIGATWGRLIGILLKRTFPGAMWAANPSKFALLGAAVQLGGVVRMTLSLTVMLIEATGSTTFGLVIMLCLVITKWVGDLFNEGVFDMHIHMLSIPFLDWEPPPLSYHITANEMMTHPVTTLRTVEKVSRIISILKMEKHNGYPLVDTPSEPHRLSFGRFRGLILRSHLLVILLHKFTDRKIPLALSIKYGKDVPPKVANLLEVVDSNKIPREVDNNSLLEHKLNINTTNVGFLSPQPILASIANQASNFFSFSCSPNYKWRKFDVKDDERQLLFRPLDFQPPSTEQGSEDNRLQKVRWAEEPKSSRRIHNTSVTISDPGEACTSSNTSIYTSPKDIEQKHNLEIMALLKPPSTSTKSTLKKTLYRSVLDRNQRLKINETFKQQINSDESQPPDELLKEMGSATGLNRINVSHLLSLDDFSELYPRYIDVSDIPFQDGIENSDELVDLQPYCCKAPYTISYSATLPRVFKLFRALGLRHLPVINEKNEVVGIITRKDIARFRWFESTIQGGAVKEINIYEG